MGLFGAGVAIAITQIVLRVAGTMILACLTSKEEQAREAGRSAADTEPLCGQCIRENGRFLVKKSLGIFEVEYKRFNGYKRALPGRGSTDPTRSLRVLRQ